MSRAQMLATAPTPRQAPSRVRVEPVASMRERAADAVALAVWQGRSMPGGGDPPPPSRSTGRVIHALSPGPARRLDDATRRAMEARFGCDFGHVRVHADGSAARAARAVGAHAYAAGSHIVFGRGAYAPATQCGQRLIAHELAHVVLHGSPDDARLYRSPAENDVQVEQAPALVSVVNNADARLLDPEQDFAELKSAKTGPESRIRNPDLLSESLKDANGKHQIIPSGTEVTVVDNRVERGVPYILVRWGEEQAWTHRDNVGRKTTRKAPADARVEVLESTTRGDREFVHIRWSGGEGWTRALNLSQLDASVATPLGGEGQLDARLSANKEKLKPATYQKEAAQRSVSADEVKTLRKVLLRVSKSRAYLRDPETGASLKPAQLERGLHGVLLDERELVVDSAPLKLSHLITLDGQEAWTAAANLAPADPRIFDEQGLILGSRLDQFQHPAVAAALERSYGLRVEELLSSKEFTTEQSALIERARAFVADRALQAAQPALEVPAYALEEDGLKLSTDLVGRLDVFYRFLTHASLIDGFFKPGMSGIRSFAAAHQLSTRWTMHPKSGQLANADGQLRFARALVEIGGWDPNTPQGTQWASIEQVMTMARLLAIVDEPSRPTIDRLLDPIAAPFELGEQPTPEEAQAQLGELVRGLYLMHPPQDAVAAEGYPKGDPRRRPNIRDTAISLHCGGEAIDVFFNYRFNFFDPIIDALALVFGLYRAARGGGSPEYWHYERIGVPLAGRVIGEDGRDTANGLESKGLEVSP